MRIMMTSTKRDSTRAVSAMVSPRPSCISAPVSMIASPPSSRIPTSNETRVRVEGRSKIMASVLPASGREAGSAPLTRAAFIAAALSRMPRNSPLESSSRSRKCRGALGTGAFMSLNWFSVYRHDQPLLDSGAGSVEPPDAFRDLLVSDDQGRDDPHHVVAGGNDQQPLIERRLGEAGRRDFELDADHEPLAANLLDHRVAPILELGEPLAHVQAKPGDPLEEARRENDVKRGVADRHGERIAAERRPVDPDGQAARRVRGRQARRHWKTSADPLGGSENIGMHAAVLIGVEA